MTSSIRTLDRLDAGLTTCLDCGAETAEAKPYCTRHLERMPYVSSLLAQLEPATSGHAAA